MRRESRQRMGDEVKSREVRLATRKKVSQILPIAGVVLAVVGIFAWVYYQSNLQKAVVITSVQGPLPKQPETCAQLLALSLSDLEKCDIARMNLLCAEGLPGVGNLNVNEDLATLDSWARHVRSEIDRNFQDYWDHPAYFDHSTNFYKMAMLARVLYEDYHIRYDPNRMVTPGPESPNDHFFANPNDVFIHGLIAGNRMGTCSSMPVLYVALGRRLGYPLKLVTTKEHLFIRWDSPTEKFDMDATSKGLNHYTDDFYRHWPFPVSDEEIKEEGYLKSLSPRDELSVFMSIRGLCQMDNGQLADATESFKAAYRLEPDWKDNQALLARAEQIQNPTRNP